ncbi:hypothetical protein [Arthrobacter cryoconiti]|uniref:Integral membrane protein n=1 Tax=Arthrobacter cryoconiti TaxID=748907 RepID=A0ABV8R487_9MICC|nr:hypothetical protein [Arthrobacter cryoconiti]MCC9066881.1 hypothetical protein [Arthrobacter cryoconiti]
MTKGGVRLARGWTAAAFATFVAALSHVMGGGAAPHPLLLLLSLSISAVVCVALAGRVLSRKNLVAAVVLSQGLFHLLFSPSPGQPMSMPASVIASGDHCGMNMGLLPGLSEQVALGHGTGLSALMWVSHAAAAVLTIIFLRHGEASTMKLIDALRLQITAIVGLVIVPIAAPSRIYAAPTLWLPMRIGLDIPLPVRHHRGPPLLAAAL